MGGVVEIEKEQTLRNMWSAVKCVREDGFLGCQTQLPCVRWLSSDIPEVSLAIYLFSHCWSNFPGHRLTEASLAIPPLERGSGSRDFFPWSLVQSLQFFPVVHKLMTKPLAMDREFRIRSGQPHQHTPTSPVLENPHTATLRVASFCSSWTRSSVLP